MILSKASRFQCSEPAGVRINHFILGKRRTKNPAFARNVRQRSSIGSPAGASERRAAGPSDNTSPSHSYTLAEHYTLTVGANNIFDTYPDRIAASPTNPNYALTDRLADGQIYPRSGGPFGTNRGFYYVRLRVTY